MKRTVIEGVIALVALSWLGTGCWHDRVHDRAVYVEPRHEEVRHDVIVEHHDDHHDDHPHY